MASPLLWVAMASATWLLLSAVASAALNAKPTTWPALRFNFTLKRSSMNIYGNSDFSMLANPVVSDNGDKVLYDVFATFQQGQTIHNYTLVDGVAFMSRSSLDDSTATPTVSCLDSESDIVPPINSIVTGINEATAMAASGSDATGCTTGSLFEVLINGIDFSLCASRIDDLQLYGDDMNIEVEYLDTQVEILPRDEASAECKTTVSPSSVTSVGKSLLTGQLLSSSERNLKAEFDFTFWSDGSKDSSQHSESRSGDHSDKHGCSCKSTPRPCIFIHGLGVKQETPHNEDSFSYWGDDLIGHTPCCSSVKFAHLNTVNNTWTSTTQQEKVCNRVLAVSNTSTKAVITDTIVVTHSMGNLMFAGALATGKCSLDPSSTWVGMAGPMLGSMASDFVQETCSGKTDRFWEEVGDITGRCPPNTGLKSLAYQNGNFSSRKLDAAYEAAQEAYRTNVSALMCGRSYSGLTSKYQAKFWVLGHTIPHKSKHNDGMVEFQSCAPGIPESKFGDNWRDRYYMTKLNHYDMQFLAGDAILDGAKMPVKWFECLL